MNALDQSALDQNELLAATAHELRRPLSHIKGFVSSLRRTDVEWDEATRSEFLADIEKETERLAQLVDSLLATRASNRGAASAEIELTTPAAIISGGLDRIRGLLQGANRRIVVSTPLSQPLIRADAGAMERVIANLVENSVKYSPPHTPITVVASIADDGELEFIVEDHGQGIPLEERARIFEPFFRQRTSQASGVPGHGLGLAVCQSIVLAHGGRIVVTDRDGGGARFRVLLPVVADVSHSTKDLSHESADHSRGGRRSTHAQVVIQQPERERIPGSVRGRRGRSAQVDRRAPVRLVAA